MVSLEPKTTASKQAQQKRIPLSALAKLHLVMILLPVPYYIWFQFAVMGGPFPPIGITNVIGTLIASSFMITGKRWGSLVGTIWGLIYLASEFTMMPYHLADPGELNNLLQNATFALIVASVGFGIAATIQNFRFAPEERITPPWLSGAASAVFGLILGASIVAGVYQPGGNALDSRLLEGLPVISVKDGMFEQTEIRVKAGERVLLAVKNGEAMFHSFDIDELNVHVKMAGNKQTVAVFQAPSTPGTYTFYCAVPGHASGDHTTGMVGKLIVE